MFRFGCSLLLAGYFLLPCLTFGQPEPAPWEKVVVIPTPKGNPSTYQDSPEVTVQYVKLKKILVYVSAFCGKDCDDMRDFFRDHNVAFEEREIFGSLEGISNLVRNQITAPTAEFLYSNGTVKRVIGFDAKILGQFIAEDKNMPQNDFGISDFDLRGAGNKR